MNKQCVVFGKTWKPEFWSSSSNDRTVLKAAAAQQYTPTEVNRTSKFAAMRSSGSFFCSDLTQAHVVDCFNKETGSLDNPAIGWRFELTCWSDFLDEKRFRGATSPFERYLSG